MELITESPRDTKAVGEKFATSLIEGKRASLVAALSGELGAGKTTFVQGFAQGIGLKQRVISPTFILMRNYKLDLYPGRFDSFYHVDLYRLESNVASEVRNLGLPEICARQGNIVLIEWAEKIKELLDSSVYWISFENFGEGRRKISISP